MAEKSVLTVGVFDLLHFGHFELFRRAKALAGSGGTLTVAVQNDASVAKYKPSAKLVYDWKTRAEMIRALRYVDHVVAYSNIDEAVKEITFDVFVVGGDQVHPGFQRAVKWCKENGREVVRLSRTDGISSSLLRNECLSI
ncbi:MAG: adenylyltransferase/cytidyltransferase family protein [Bacteroides sp.]|nr:adenylyltransferase/cytidyltransferase family protein [Prevotella sp.]MCM1408276.1 adenylyltransferase/cytidyltransferase family protein [Treponema brennaborense]MCM1470492.1 adenylyltransferase/cytidyltransferase family protein [Bacteroides sp.]